MPRLSLEGHYKADSRLKGDINRLGCNRYFESLKLLTLSACQRVAKP